MRLAKIEHDRCHELAAVTYVWVPDQMSASDFSEAVKRAQKAYIEFLNVYKEDVPPNTAGAYSSPRFHDYPDLTVQEVIDKHNAEREEYKAWEEKRRQAQKGFRWYLEQEGLIDFYAHDPAWVHSLDWGHRHGTKIDYNETQPEENDLPGAIEPDEEDW